MKKMDFETLKNIPEVTLSDVILRAVRYEDYKDMFAYGKDDLVTERLLWDSYKDISEAEVAVKNVFLSRPSKGLPSAYAIVDNKTGKMIGTCDFCKVDWEKNTGEIGYVIHRAYWGKGIMTRVCDKVIDFGFNYLGLDKIAIGHYENNIGSKRVIEKCGFKYTHVKTDEQATEPIWMYELNKEHLVLRKATIDDSDGKGRCHYYSWIETYTGLINQDYLDARSEERCVELAYKYPMNTYVVKQGGNVIGFSAYNESRDEDLSETGEIRAIYVLKKYQKQGAGRLLMDACYHALKDYPKLMLYVLATNQQAIDFYERLGFKKDGHEKFVKASETTTLHEVRMIRINPVYRDVTSV